MGGNFVILGTLIDIGRRVIGPVDGETKRGDLFARGKIGRGGLE